jgi:hypothetical protein
LSVTRTISEVRWHADSEDSVAVIVANGREHFLDCLTRKDLEGLARVLRELRPETKMPGLMAQPDVIATPAGTDRKT